ncbi:hypothetical protein GCM10007036_18600 [Alsobacter metallidurans]|uniref:Secreted protein n=1 Tax=Alsobacter metallidurans TaxID=340221 RepID=A0A917I6T0_9HYPH|nr:hypothetical protein GCM10007036_18600 [Alsobacter metallidurans]
MQRFACTLALLAFVAIPQSASAQNNTPCRLGDPVSRRCPDSPLYNRRGVDIRPTDPSPAFRSTPFQSPFGSGESRPSQQEQLRRRNGSPQ